MEQKTLHKIENGKISYLDSEPLDQGINSVVSLKQVFSRSVDIKDLIGKITSAHQENLVYSGRLDNSPYVAYVPQYFENGEDQIETSMTPKELLGALNGAGLITQEEMIEVYTDMGLGKSNRFLQTQQHSGRTHSTKI